MVHTTIGDGVLALGIGGLLCLVPIINPRRGAPDDELPDGGDVTKAPGYID
jgi:hypothetical protein